jgi:3-oxoadipate enol-lactonase
MTEMMIAPVLVMAHSLGSNLHLFDKLMPELLRHFRVVRYDDRGHGASVVTPGPYSIAQLGQDALGILDALGLEKVHWIGLSKGGMVGLWLASHAPERIARAVIANVTAYYASPDMWNERIQVVHEKGLQTLVPFILESWFTKGFRERHPDEVERIREILLATPGEGYAGACAALRDMDLREAIRKIANPVLVIIGRHDTATSPGLGALVASAIPGAKLMTLDAAHISAVEDPEGFVHAAIEFLTAEAPVVGQMAPAKKPQKPKVPRKTPAATVEGHGVTAAAAAPILKPAAAAPQPHKPAAKKTAAKKIAAKKAPVKKVAAKKSPARKVVGKKTASKKAALRKVRAAAPARKPVVKKTVAKKAAAKKAVGKKTPAKKTIAKKAVAKKLPIRKIAAKKALVRKAVVKKTQAKKAGVKKAATKKPAGRKPMPRHLPGRRPPARKR